MLEFVVRSCYKTGQHWEAHFEMSKTSTVHARIEPELKEHAERILSEIGLNPSVAVGILYRTIVSEQGFPIPLRVPNRVTIAALENASQGAGLEDVSSVYDLLGEDGESAEESEPIQEGPPSRKKAGAKSEET